MSNVIEEDKKVNISENITDSLVKECNIVDEDLITLFELVDNYPKDRFLEVDKTTRNTFLQLLEGKSFNIKDTDFISLIDSRIAFKYLKGTKERESDIGIEVFRKEKNIFKLTTYDKTEVRFISEKSFVLEALVKLEDNKVKSKNYAMIMTVVKDSINPLYVFSVSFANLEDEDIKIRVYANHKKPGTVGVGRN